MQSWRSEKKGEKTMAGKDIRLGELLGAIPSVTEFNLTFYNMNSKERRYENCSREEVKEHSNKEVFFIHRITYSAADITLLEEEENEDA